MLGTFLEYQYGCWYGLRGARETMAILAIPSKTTRLMRASHAHSAQLRWVASRSGVGVLCHLLVGSQAQDFLGRLTRSGTETHDLGLDPSIEAVRVCVCV